MVASAKANRAFLGRVVRYLAGEASIRQFLDIGSGMPSVGNTHEIAQDAGRHSQQSPIPLTGQRPPRGQGASRQFRDHACHSPVPAGDPRDIIRAVPVAGAEGALAPGAQGTGTGRERPAPEAATRQSRAKACTSREPGTPAVGNFDPRRSNGNYPLPAAEVPRGTSPLAALTRVSKRIA
jgi:S-adenosyl methyltransferase